jgi:tetratricopeptide (TPR) repeat protein
MKKTVQEINNLKKTIKKNMKKIMLSVVAILFSCYASNAQKAAVVSAWNYLNNGELNEAKASIDGAINDETTKIMAKTWVYRGKIYLAISSDSALRIMEPGASEVAYESFMKAFELDAEKKTYSDDIGKGLQGVAYNKFNEGVAPYNNKQYDKAFSEFSKVSTIYEFLNKNYQTNILDTTSMYYAAYSAFQVKKYNEASSLFNKLLTNNYLKSDIYQGLELISLAQKDTTAALKHIEDGRKLFPNEMSLVYDELNIYLSQNRNQEVIDKLKDAIAKKPDSHELNFLLASKYDKNFNDTTNAKKYYLESIKIKPDYFDAYYSLGVLYYNIAFGINEEIKKLPNTDQKNYDRLIPIRNKYFELAIPYMEKANTILPEDRDTLIALKQLYITLKMTAKYDSIVAKIKALGY